MKALGFFLVGALAVAGGIAAATYVTKKKLEKENEDNYYDDWDSDFDDDWDFDFDEDMDVEDEPSLKKVVADSVPEAAPESGAKIDEVKADSAADDIFGSADDLFSSEPNDEV